MSHDSRPFTPGEFADALGCCRHTVDTAIKNRIIPAARIGRRYFIPRRIANEILETGRIPSTESRVAAHSTGGTK